MQMHDVLLSEQAFYGHIARVYVQILTSLGEQLSTIEQCGDGHRMYLPSSCLFCRHTSLHQSVEAILLL
jgi:hypothetical protein